MTKPTAVQGQLLAPPLKGIGPFHFLFAIFQELQEQIRWVNAGVNEMFVLKIQIHSIDVLNMFVYFLLA